MKSTQFSIITFSLFSLSMIHTSDNLPNQKNSLYFYINHKDCIEAFRSQGNMEFQQGPLYFVNKEFYKAFPLTPQDIYNIQQAFAKAKKTEQKDTVTYTCEEKTFLATINPLYTLREDGSRGNHFMVKVTEAPLTSLLPQFD